MLNIEYTFEKITTVLASGFGVVALLHLRIVVMLFVFIICAFNMNLRAAFGFLYSSKTLAHL